MSETKSALTVHVTIHPDKHPAVYAALVSVDPRARSHRLTMITETALGRQGASSVSQTDRPSPVGMGRTPDNLEEIASLLGLAGGAAG